jgi:hypothetical protein
MSETQKGGPFNIPGRIEYGQAFVAVVFDLQRSDSHFAFALLAVLVHKDHEHIGGKIAETFVAFVGLSGDFKALLLGRLR